MKYTKQILEAVNRGIRLALDDFDDEVQDQAHVLSKKKIQNYDPERDILTYEGFVDLGLPSGTLWAKYNLGVSIESTNPRKSLVGGFYAWGEIKPRKEFTIKRYKFGDDVIESGSTKYNTEDKIYQLEPSDDAVTAYYKNSNYHIPTIKEANELLEYTNVYFINCSNKYNINLLKEYPVDGDFYRGWLFISKVNNNYIFFPNAGIYRGQYLYLDDDPASAVWLSTISDNWEKSSIDTCAHSISFYLDKTKVKSIYGNYKHYGLQIRPVYNNYEIK